MTKVKTNSKTSSKSHDIRPALTDEGRENQLIYLATELAEQQLRDGTASSQVITHYLKLGTCKEKLEREKLEEENKLLRARTKAIKDAADMKEMYAEAIKAMQRYGGHGSSEEYDEEEYY